MLDARFQDHRTIKFCRRIFLKVFTIYGHGGHLGRVTWTIYINFRSPFKRMAPHEIWHRLAKWLQRRRYLKIMVKYMYIAPGQGQTTPWGVLFS